MKIAIIATDSPQAEELLTDLARQDGFAVVCVKPEKSAIFDALRRIDRELKKKVREIRIHADKPVAEYAETAKTFFKFDIEIYPIERLF